MMRSVASAVRVRMGGMMATASAARPAVMRYVAPLSTTGTPGTTGGTATFSNPPKPNELFDSGIVKTQGASSSSSSSRDEENNKEFDRVVGTAGEDTHTENHMKAAADALKDEGAIDQQGLPKNAGPEGQPLDEDVVNDTSSHRSASEGKGNKPDDDRRQSMKEATEARSQASSDRSDYST